MLSLTRWLVVLALLSAPGVSATPSRVDANGLRSASRAHSPERIVTASLAKRAPSVAQHELALPSTKIRLAPLARSSVLCIASRAYDLRGDSAHSTYDATGPPHRS